MELICGACHGRLLAELPGTTVACPHCGVHLQTPAAETVSQIHGADFVESGDGSAGCPNPATDTVRMDVWVPPERVPDAPFQQEGVSAEHFLPTAAAASAGAPELVAAVTEVPSPVAGTKPADGRVDSAVTLPPADNAGAANPASDVALSDGALVDNPHPMAAAEFVTDVGSTATSSPVAAHEVSTSELEAANTATSDELSTGIPAAEFSPSPEPAFALGSLQSGSIENRRSGQSVAARQAARPGISRTLFVIVLSYASAMTLACLYLAFQLFNNPRTLDLPDLVPPPPKDKKKVTSLIYLSPDQEVPPANVLKLGESRQYGSLMVTPLRVTRGPLAFEYYEPEADQQREPEGPVLKLHLRFENVSREQEFIPLDSKLVFSKEIDRKAYGLFKANNFVSKVADRKNPAKLVYMFDLTPNGNWLLKGENLDHDIAPGQLQDAFVPTTAEGIGSLSGDLVWRVHFRKGYNRKSFRGVTTLIEVLFKGSDVLDEKEPAPDDPTPVEPAIEDDAVKDA